MSIPCQEEEILLKKIVAAVFFNPKSRYITKIYITNHRILMKNQKNQIIKLSYNDIHEITVQDSDKIHIRCNTPMRFFDENEDHVSIFIYGLKRKAGGGLTKLSDPGWPLFWRNFIYKRIKVFQDSTAKKKQSLQYEDNEPKIIEKVKRSKSGIGQFEIVKSRDTLDVWLDDFIYPSSRVYSTGSQFVIKIGDEDYILVPYSVIYDYQIDNERKICIIFSFPQKIEGFENEISKMSLKKISDSADKYHDQITDRWYEDWMDRLKQVTAHFYQHKGAVGADDMLDILMEIKHSPAKYNLSSYSKQGWDRACGLALERFRLIGDDLFLYMNFLLSEYEEMKIRVMAEPDPARQEAFLGSEMAYSAILRYINYNSRAN